MYEVQGDARPPYVDPAARAHAVLPGETWYDWPTRRMTEWYPERCIDIFPDGRDFPCQFTSVHDRTWLITFSTGDPATPATCCRWPGPEFWAPRPDVLRTMEVDAHAQATDAATRWWSLEIPSPGPFGYGIDAEARPVAFWFPILHGWVQQEFDRFEPAAVSEDRFALPPICQGEVPICGG